MKRTLEYLKTKIPFNRPCLIGRELEYIKHAYSLGQLSGDGYYTQKCHQWLERHLGIAKVLLTHSATAALEMMALLSKVGRGDEIIMPSFTFVTTANAFVLRGTTPVFVDIREDTLNIDEELVEPAITRKTKAIVVVHYAGVGCEMDKILRLAQKYNLLVFEDAAQAFLAKYKNSYLGTLGDLGAFSFHETKNIISGEGGALLVNKKKYFDRAEVIREKGTNRSSFLKGEVDKYTWVDLGSSYLPGEIMAAFLFAQLENARKMTRQRKRIWENYQEKFANLEKKGHIRRPIVPRICKHNGHLYYLLVEDLKTRDALINYLKKKGILSVFHYIPLHSSPAGERYAKTFGSLAITESISQKLLRLPLYYGLSIRAQEYVIESVYGFFK